MNLLNKLRYVPKRFGVVAAIVAATVIPAALFAWGPTDRPTFTIENPANYVTFNSITNNPNYGDERNFVTVKDATNTTAGGWQDEITVQPGKEYLVRTYVHNNANANLNLVAENTRVKANVPTTSGKSLEINGFVSADNAQPKEIWDQVILKSDSNFNAAYVAGSATLYTNKLTSGAQLSDSIVTSTGAQVGYDKIDGKVPGCFEFTGIVTYKVKIQGEQTANFDFTKDVRKSGTTDKYAETVATKPGDKVDFRLSFKNNGQATLNNVVIKDQLPAGLNYVADSAKLYNSNYPSGYALSSELLTTGVNIGHYSTGINAFVVFTAQVAANDKLPVCGVNTLNNIAKAESDFGGKSDNATVTVPKECLPPAAKYSCDALTVAKISRTQFNFVATRTVENATYVRTVFIVRDASGTELTRVNDQDGTYSYTQSKTGTYSVEAQIVVSVEGQEKVATSDNCKKTFEVVEQPVTPVYECTSLELIKKSRDSFEFKTTARAEGNVTIKEVSVDFGDNQKQTVDYGKNAAHTYAAPGTYTSVATVVFTVDGKTVNKTSDACKVSVVVEQPPVVPPVVPPVTPPVTPVVTPGVPAEIPSTGPEALLGGLFGSSALGLGVTSFIRSRRALRDSLNR